jgi:hypothetical protein
MATQPAGHLYRWTAVVDGQRLRELRRQRALSQAEFGHAVGSPRGAPRVLPFGVLGTPLRVAWDVGVYLLQASNTDALDVVARHLAGLCRRYDEMMNLARVNDHLWKHAAAPVDVGDIEIIGITTLSVSHFGQNNLAQAIIANGLDPNGISFIPFDLGVELAGGLAEPIDVLISSTLP